MQFYTLTRIRRCNLPNKQNYYCTEKISASVEIKENCLTQKEFKNNSLWYLQSELSLIPRKVSVENSLGNNLSESS